MTARPCGSGWRERESCMDDLQRRYSVGWGHADCKPALRRPTGALVIEGGTGTSPPTPRARYGSRGEREKKGVSRGRKRQAPQGTPSKEHSHPILPAAWQSVKRPDERKNRRDRPG